MTHSYIFTSDGAVLTEELISDLEEARESFFKQLDIIQEKYKQSNNLNTIRVMDSYHSVFALH